MSLGCKGLCRFEKRRANKQGYKDGYRRCSTCERYLKTDELRCYCCGTKLRIGAQTNIYRQKRRDMVCVRIE